MNLRQILEHLDETLAWATRESPAPTVLLERAFSEEAGARIQSRFEYRLKKSGLKERKTLEAFEWAFQPKLDKAVVLELARLEFVRRREDLIITGKSGTGKSHILQALALKACEQPGTVRYARCVDLLNDLYAGLADGSYAERLRRWARPDLLVIDDVGLGQVKKREDEPTAAHALFDLLDRRHGKVSTALTSNVRLAAWGQYLGDATIAAAILDRLVMRAVRIDIDGPSYRQRLARDRAKERGTKPPEEDQA